MAPTDERTRLRSLAAMARALARSAPLTQHLEVAAEEARRALGAASVSVSRLEPGTLSVRTVINVGDLGPHEVRWPHDEVYTIDEFANLDLVVENLQTWISDIRDPDCNPSERELLEELEKGSSLGAPIIVDDELWGEFYATRHVGDPCFSASEASYLEALVAILAGAVSRALREESLEELASRDPLTGLLNRRALDERARRVFEVPAGAARNVTAVAVDINGLKEVNDSKGHPAGDAFIKSVAQTLQQEFGRFSGALVARIGGDEFCVLVPRHDPSLVIAVADHLSAQAWDFCTGAGISCGASTAVLTAASTMTPHELFTAADQAQYVAKRGRLSTVVVSGDLPAHSAQHPLAVDRAVAG